MSFFKNALFSIIITVLSYFAGFTWLKVLSHDTAYGYFANLEQAKSHNADDPEAPLYSILDQVENFRKEGVFHVKVCYRELPPANPCNEWKQSSNFVEEADITDFDPIELTWKESGTGGEFGGLGLSPASFSVNLIDDLPHHGNWWWSIGTLASFGKGLPGPHPNDVRKVELYVGASKIKIKLHLTLLHHASSPWV